MLMFKEMETGIAELSINTLSNGNYFIKVQSGKYTYTEQIIKY
ncbi:MAG: T9SS type A sorting domain-containing protein [Crocinitomicaceae bacterium]